MLEQSSSKSAGNMENETCPGSSIAQRAAKVSLGFSAAADFAGG